MGHSANPNKVTKYASVLEEIKTSIDSGQEVRFPCKLEGVKNLCEKIRSILRSAELFSEEFADLNQRVTTSADWDSPSAVVRPKGTTQAHGLRSQVPDEFAAAKTLNGPFCELHFKPSPNFTPERFDSLIREQYGYTVRHLTDDPGDPYFDVPAKQAGDFNEQEPKAEGWKSYIAVRLPKEKPDRPSVLEQFGFSRSDS